MTLTRNELVLLKEGTTDVLRIIIIINNQYQYVFVSQAINPLALRARSRTITMMMMRRGSERSERQWSGML